MSATLRWTWPMRAPAGIDVAGADVWVVDVSAMDQSPPNSSLNSSSVSSAKARPRLLHRCKTVPPARITSKARVPRSLFQPGSGQMSWTGGSISSAARYSATSSRIRPSATRPVNSSSVIAVSTSCVPGTSVSCFKYDTWRAMRSHALSLSFPPVHRPGHAPLDALFQRHPRIVVQQGACFADVGHISGDLTCSGRCELDARLFPQSLADIGGQRDQAVSLAIGQIDRVIPFGAAHQEVNARGNSLDAIVDVRKVEFLLGSVDRNGLAVSDPVDEERRNPLHAFDVVVVAPVDVAEPEDQEWQLIAARVGMYQSLAGNLARRIRALRDHEVGLALLGDVALYVAVYLPGAAEDDGHALVTAEFKHIERHADVLQCALGVLDQLIYLGMGRQMHHDIEVRRIRGIADARDKLGLRSVQILDNRLDSPRPWVGTDIDTIDIVPLVQEMQDEVGPDLSTRTGDEDAHKLSLRAFLLPQLSLRRTITIGWALLVRSEHVRQRGCCVYALRQAFQAVLVRRRDLLLQGLGNGAKAQLHEPPQHRPLSIQHTLRTSFCKSFRTSYPFHARDVRHSSFLLYSLYLPPYDLLPRLRQH